MKKLFTLFIAALLIVNTMALPAMAEEGQSTEESTATSATEAPKPTEPTPTESTPAAEEPQPTQPSMNPTAPSTEATEPKPCTHTYGDWDGDEGSHWRTCTQCGHRESAGHSWAAETVTVAPTCADPGGVCKICTVCQGVLVTEIIPQTAVHTYDNDCDAECNVCGAKREVTHSFGTGWKYSYKGHWHTCTVCGAAGEVKSHYPGPAATEEKDQICLTCGYIMTQKLGHSHKYASQWSSDETGHWYACTGCGEKDRFADHRYDDTCDPDCNDCGYVRDTAHEYNGWLSDEVAHWQICEVCMEETEQEAHILNEDGTHCQVCQAQLAEAHEHEFAPEWLKDETSHWQECDCGEKAQEAEHQWDEGSEEDSMITYTCEVCQAEKQEEAPQSGIPWWIFLIAAVLVAALAAALICLIMAGKKRTGTK